MEDPMDLRTPSDLAALIRDRRRALGWTQQDLADRCGSTKRWIVALEGGKSSLNLGKVLAALAALDLVLVVRPRSDTPGSPLDAYLDGFSS
jgi:y4mF family transcriptional regulator